MGVALCASSLGVARETDGPGIGGGIYWRVDVGAVGERFAPEAEAAGRIEPLRFAEGRDRGRVVETISKAEAPVEIALRLRVRRGDWEMDLA